MNFNFIQNTAHPEIDLIQNDGIDTIITIYDASKRDAFFNLNTLEISAVAKTASGGTGNDTLSGSTAADSLSGLGGNDELYGYDGNDTLNGGTGDDWLEGGNGADVLNGNDGADFLYGGAGADKMTGGAGNDIYVVDNLTDKAIEGVNSGLDIVLSLINYTLPANVEFLALMGDVAKNATGNNEATNFLFGNDLANVLSGLGGSDWLFGDHGKDTLIGGSGQDVFEASLNLGADIFKDFSIVDDDIALDSTVFTAVGSTVDTGEFRKGAGVIKAADANDYLIYNTTTGNLYYDGDGSGATKAAVLIATIGVTTHPSITAADFGVY